MFSYRFMCLPTSPLHLTLLFTIIPFVGALADSIASNCDRKAQHRACTGSKCCRGKDHVGLMFMLRNYVALSLRRRSVRMLATSTSLAARFGVSLDELLAVGEGSGSPESNLLAARRFRMAGASRGLGISWSKRRRRR